MKTAVRSSRSAMLAAGAAAALALAAMGFAGNAQARDNVQWSVGVGVPGAVVNVGNVGSVYPQPYPVYVPPPPVYVQPAPVYVRPAPVYVQPRPVFVQPGPVYVQPAPVYYGRPHGHKGKGGHYVQGPRHGYGPAYGPVYYARDGRDGNRHGGRDHNGHGREDSRRDGRDNGWHGRDDNRHDARHGGRQDGRR